MPTSAEQQFWLAIVSSSLVSGCLSLFVTGWRENRRDKREMRADGLNVARALEQYTRSCARMIDASSYAVGQAHHLHDHRPLNAINLPTYEAPEAAWKYFSPDLADRIKGLPDSISDSNHELGQRWLVDDIEDKFELVDEIERLVIKFGYMAWDLAKMVRSEFGLPDAQVSVRMSGALETLKVAKQVQDENDQRRAVRSQTAD